jgi:hypothetical protein
MTYTLRRIGQTWRIVVAAIHAPDGVLLGDKRGTTSPL